MIVAYLLTVVIANMVTVIFPPLVVWRIIIPPSAFFMGFTFLLGNKIQNRYGGKKANQSLFVGLILTSIICLVFRYPQSIVIASGTAFLVSQQVAQILNLKLKKSLAEGKANLYSSLVGSLIDVVLFITIGLSPWGIGSVSWGNIGWAIVGQLAVQMILQWLSSEYFLKD